MKKSYVSLLAAAILITTVLAHGSIASAQMVNCPSGFTCTPVAPSSMMCPVGYSCTPILTTITINGMSASTPAPTMHVMLPGLRGVVSSLNVTTITVNGTGFSRNATSTFTVYIGNAPIYKNNATSTIANVAIGDKVFIQGTLGNTYGSYGIGGSATLTATSIHDHGMNFWWQTASSTFNNN